MAIVTLTDARRNLAEKLGGYRLFTSGVQDTPPDGSYVGTASGADSKRRVVSSDLVLLDVAGTSTPVATERWKYSTLYVPSIPIQRVVAEKGFSAAKLASDVTDEASLTTTYVGMVTLAQPLATDLPAGEECELHGVMPPLAIEQGRGLHACINRALRFMTFPDRITFDTVDSSYRYDLSAYPWLTSEAQLRGVFDSESLANTDPDPLRRGGSIRFDAQTPYLSIDIAPQSTSFYVEFERPVGSWVRVGGTWQASTTGLVNETDAVFCDPDKLTQAAYYYVCEALARAWRADPIGQYWAEERDKSLATVATIAWMDKAVRTQRPHRGTTSSVYRTTLGGTASRSWP